MTLVLVLDWYLDSGSPISPFKCRYGALTVHLSKWTFVLNKLCEAGCFKSLRLFILDVLKPGRFEPWTIRTLDVLNPGRFVFGRLVTGTGTYRVFGRFESEYFESGGLNVNVLWNGQGICWKESLLPF